MSEKSVTINTVAKLAKTSKTTVSFYLNGKFEKMSDETRKRIEKAIKATNYHPSIAARCLNRKRTKMVGVILGDITNSFSNQVVKGIENVALQQNYQIVFGNSNYDSNVERKYIDRMLNMGVDGLIVQPTPEFPDADKKIGIFEVPVVFLDSSSKKAANSRVGTDSRTATCEATKICIEKGYEDFIMLTADPSKLSVRKDRTSSFISTLKKSGKTCSTMLLRTETAPDEISGFIADHLRLNRRTLIFVPTCWALPSVYLAMGSIRNLIPNTVGIIGFDNTEWTQFSVPSITTIVQPAYEEGRIAMELLYNIISGIQKRPAVKLLDCTISWCESTNLNIEDNT